MRQGLRTCSSSGLVLFSRSEQIERLLITVEIDQPTRGDELKVYKRKNFLYLYLFVCLTQWGMSNFLTRHAANDSQLDVFETEALRKRGC